MQKQPLADFQQKACSVKSQRYDELHDTGAATMRATIHRSSRIHLLSCALRHYHVILAETDVIKLLSTNPSIFSVIVSRDASLFSVNSS